MATYDLLVNGTPRRVGSRGPQQPLLCVLRGARFGRGERKCGLRTVLIDATGARLTEVPFTPQRVKEALRAAG